MSLFTWLKKKFQHISSRFAPKNINRLGKKIKAPVLSPTDAVRFGVFLSDERYTRSSIIWLLLSFTGARCEDILALRKRDIEVGADPKTNKITRLNLKLANFKNDRRAKIPDKVIMDRRTVRPVILTEAHGALFAIQQAIVKMDIMSLEDNDFVFMPGRYAGDEFRCSSAYNMFSSDIRQVRANFRCVDSLLVNVNEISSHSSRRCAVTSLMTLGVPITTVSTFAQCNPSNIARYNVVTADQILDVAGLMSCAVAAPETTAPVGGKKTKRAPAGGKKTKAAVIVLKNNKTSKRN